MPVSFYMDVHVPLAITNQLRRRGIDVLTAIEDRRESLDDGELLKRSSELGRVLFTQDIRFEVLARTWQRDNRSFAGLIFGHQLGATLGNYVIDLELIANQSDADEWESVVERLPF